MMAAMGLGGVGALALKALGVSMMALMLAGAAALKKVKFMLIWDRFSFELMSTCFSLIQYIVFIRCYFLIHSSKFHPIIISFIIFTHISFIDITLSAYRRRWWRWGSPGPLCMYLMFALFNCTLEHSTPWTMALAKWPRRCPKNYTDKACVETFFLGPFFFLL